MYSVYVVSAKRCDYDQYDAVVVIAKSKKQALDIVEHDSRKYGGERYEYFYKEQYPLCVDCVCRCNASEPQVVLASFNAG